MFTFLSDPSQTCLYTRGTFCPAPSKKRLRQYLPAALGIDALLRRLHLPTARRLYPELMHRAEPEGLGYRDFLAMLMAEEVAHRAQTRIQHRVRRAHFPFLKRLEEFDLALLSCPRARAPDARPLPHRQRPQRHRQDASRRHQRLPCHPERL